MATLFDSFRRFYNEYVGVLTKQDEMECSDTEDSDIDEKTSSTFEDNMSLQKQGSLFNDLLSGENRILQEEIANYQLKIVERDKELQMLSNKLIQNWNKEKPTSSKIQHQEALKKLKSYEDKAKRLASMMDQNRRMRQAMEIAEVGEENDSDMLLIEMENEIQELKDNWGEIDKIVQQLDAICNSNWTYVDPKKLRKQLDSLANSLLQTPAGFRESAVAKGLMDKLDFYKSNMNIICDLRTIPLKPHHIKAIKQKTKLNLDDKSMTFGAVINEIVSKHSGALKEIVVIAQGEVALEEFLQGIEKTWAEYTFQLVTHQKKHKLITGFDALFELLNEHITCVAAMKLSPYFKQVKSFEEQAKFWETKLHCMLNLMDLWIQVQRRWIHLESIFSDSSELREVLKKEAKKFSSASAEFIGALKKIEADPRPSIAINIPNITKLFERLNKELTDIQKSLGDYLESQRAAFPRFYFAGDEDLLEIFGHSKDLLRVQRHFRKMFAGLNEVRCSNDNKTIQALISKEGETLPLAKTIVIEKNSKVNEWLSQMEEEMKYSLATALVQCYGEIQNDTKLTHKELLTEWIDRYAAQLLTVAVQIHWSEKVDQALPMKAKNRLEPQMKKVDTVLNNLACMVIDEQPDMRRAKLEYLIIEFVHQRDVIRQLKQLNIQSADDFVWVSLMRFYIDTSKERNLHSLSICVANASLHYGYEYLGIADKIVQTPLTDRCYLTMTQALEFRLGGSPFGPAGTGKTESVKALGQQMGRFVLVFNCDETFNFYAMGRIFLGLCQVGAWGCFDEFNRLEEGVLSAVSQQIQTIQEGLAKAKSGNFKLELQDRKISLNPNVAIFITMNPGYAGRSNLPNNLKELFRALAMTHPDRQLIAQVMLFSQGFTEAERLSKKIVPLFKLCDEQLSSQPHYDFGLRALKSVLRSAGQLKRVIQKQAPSAKASFANKQTTKNKVDALSKNVCRQKNESNAVQYNKSNVKNMLSMNRNNTCTDLDESEVSASTIEKTDNLLPPNSKPEESSDSPSSFKAAVKKPFSISVSKDFVKADVTNVLGEDQTADLEKKEKAKRSMTFQKKCSEEIILIQSIMETILPKLVADDIPLLHSLLNDVFPGGFYEQVLLRDLQDALRQICHEEYLIYNDKPGQLGYAWLEKVLQLYLISNINHGFVLVGPSSSGKTAARNCLMKALKRIDGHASISYIIDPKAMPKEELYGALDPNTNEWTDGIFTHILRSIVGAIESDPSEVNTRQWIVFDGDVDPLWVENLNSVLDDNKLLTLPNGERLALPANVRIVFEVQDLKFATLATVSRCGIIWFSEEVMPIQLRVEAYFEMLKNHSLLTNENIAERNADGSFKVGTLTEEIIQIQKQIAVILQVYFEKDGLVEKAIEYGKCLEHVMDYTWPRIIDTLFAMVSNQVKECVASITGEADNQEEEDEEASQIERNLVISDEALRQAICSQFFITLVWSISGDCDWAQRQICWEFVRDQSPPDLPDVEGFILNYGISNDHSQLLCWSDSVPKVEVPPKAIMSSDTVIPTIDTIRHEHMLVTMIRERRPLILCGPPGSGKTMTLLSALRAFPEMECVALNFSNATTPELLLQTFEQYCDYKKTTSGFTLCPKIPDKIVVFFCDEINLPYMDDYCTVRVICFLRDLLENNSYYRISDKSLIKLDRIYFVGACNPPTDPGRKPLSHRFLRHITLLYVDYPAEEALIQIYGTFCQALLKNQPAMPTDTYQELTQAMVTFYLQTQQHFNIDMQPHYVYSPRELTRWIKGIYIAVENEKNLKKPQLVRLWYHEGLRLFHDRLVDTEHQEWTIQQLTAVAEMFTQIDLEAALKPPVFYSNLLSASYVPVTEKDLRSYIQQKLKMFGQEEMETKLVLTTPLLDHILRIDRVLKQFQGHLLLVGTSGVGKNILTHFVSWLNDMSVFHIRCHRKYTMAHFDEDLRNVLKRVALQNEKITFVIDQSSIFDSSFLERINTLLANGEIPGLFEGEDYSTLMSQVRDVATKEGYVAESADDLYRWFVGKICKKLHIVYTMMPTLDGLKGSLSVSPALFNRCVINWMGDWSNDVYFHISYQLISELKLNKVAYNPGPHMYAMCTEFPEEPNMQHIIANAMLYIHEVVKRFAEMLRLRSLPTITITPRHFIDMTSQYIGLVKNKINAFEDQVKHLSAGVQKIQSTVSVVGNLKGGLEDAKKILEDMSKKIEEKSKQVAEKKREAEGERKKLSASNEQLLEKTKLVDEKKEQARRSLDCVKPLMDEAKEAVSSIRKDDIRELKVMKNPPAPVKQTLECVCLMMQLPCNDWKAILQSILRDDFLKTVLNFQSEDISDRIRKSLEWFKNDPNLSYERVNRASTSCGPLAQWVHAQLEYSRILQQIQPLRDEMAACEAEANKMQLKMDSMQKKLRNVEAKQHEFEQELVALEKELSDTKRNLTQNKEGVNRSGKLIASLSDECNRWSKSLKEIKKEKITVYGRCLLLAAFLTYAGYFDESVRHELMKAWCSHLSDNGIPSIEALDDDSSKSEKSSSESSLFTITHYNTDSDERMAWQKYGLPADQLCEENAIILKRFQRYPLIIDPSGQATKYIIKLYEDKLKRISVLDPKFRNELEMAVRFGALLLVEDIETYDPLLNTVLDREIRQMSGRAVIEIADNSIDISPTFQLFLMTRESSCEFEPDLIARVTMVNFTVTKGSVRNQCFDMFLSAENPEIYEKKNQLIKTQTDGRLRQRVLETKLLDVLAKAEGNLLENDSVLTTIAGIKKEIGEINEILQNIQQTMRQVDDACSVYQSVSMKCSEMFLLLNALQRIHFLYLYNLPFLLGIYTQVLYSNPNLSNEKDRMKRLEIIQRDLFQLFYSRVAPSLLEQHKILFATLLSGIYISEQLETETNAKKEFQQFWKTAADQLLLVDENADENDEKLECLTAEEMRAARRAISGLTEFYNTEDQLKTDEGREWLLSSTPEESNIILWDETNDCEQVLKKGVTTALHMMTLTQAFRPDRLLSAMKAFVQNVFGKEFMKSEEGTLQFAEVVALISPNTPILLCTVQGMDASATVERTAKVVGRQLHYTAIGSKEGFPQAEKRITMASKNGDWMLLKNVHLAPKWLMELEKNLRDTEHHENFRIFMTSEIHPKLPINLIRSARIFICELPPGFKANMIRSIFQVPHDIMEKAPEVRSILYFALCWLHAVVQERLRYTGIGWTKVYEFGENDLLIALRTVDAWIERQNTQDSSTVSWTAIQSLLGNCVYGNKMDNVVDQRLIESITTCIVNKGVVEGNEHLINTKQLQLKIPQLQKKEDFMKWINEMLVHESPSWMGLSDNANIVLLRNNVKSIMLDYKLTIPLLKEETIDFSQISRPSRIVHGLQLTDERAAWMNELDDLVQYWSDVLPKEMKLLSRNDTRIKNPLFRFFDREIHIADNTCKIVHRDFDLITKMIEGKVKVTREQATMIENLKSGIPPKEWVPCIIPPDMSVNMWLKNFNSRLQQLDDIACCYSNNELPSFNDVEIWIGGLFMPDAYITATRQAVSQIKRVALENLQLAASIKQNDDDVVNENEFLITDLYLAGAEFTGKDTMELISTLGVPVEQMKLKWVTKANDDDSKYMEVLEKIVQLPVYLNGHRSRLLFELEFGTNGSVPDFYRRGVALLLSN